MSGDMKHYPPSELKLERQRKAGVVPRSRDLSTFGIAFGVFIAWIAFVVTLGESLSSYLRFAFTNRCSDSAGDFSSKCIARAGSELFGISFSFFVPILMIVFLIGAYQARFIFTMAPLKVNFGRVVSFGDNLFKSWTKRVSVAFAGGLKVLMWSGVSVLLLTYYFGELPNDLNRLKIHSVFEVKNQEVWFACLDSLRGHFVSFFIVCLGFSFFIGLLSRFVVVMVYRNELRMTRSEIEAESREAEVSSEMKSSIKELMKE